MKKENMHIIVEHVAIYIYRLLFLLALLIIGLSACIHSSIQQETPVSETPVSEASNMRHADDIRSPSPSLSISGSETSSIMQKLKKMRSHMDEK